MWKALAVSLSFGVAACGGGASVTEITGPGIVRCQASLSEPPTPVPPSGATVSTTVSAQRECAWTAGAEAAWISVSPSSGQGEGTLTIQVAENTVAAARNGAIVLNDVRVTLAQEPAPCRFDLSNASTSAAHTGGTTSVSLVAVTGCAWNAASDAAWLRVLTPSGSGSATVGLAIDPNPGGARTAEAVIAGLRFTVTQAASPLAPPPSEAPPANPPAPPPTSPTPPAPPPTGPTPPAPGTPTPPTPPPPPTNTTPPGPTPPPPTNTPPPAPTEPPPPSNTTPPGPTEPPPPTNTTPPGPTQPPPPTNPPGPGSTFEATGVISGLGGTCPVLTFQLNGKTIETDSLTTFRGSCTALRDGRTVLVRGTITQSGAVRAELVERQN